MPITSARNTILIVEDDVTFGRVLETSLEQRGLTVELATTSARARQLLAQRSFDVVVADLKLNPGSGRDLLRGLRTTAPEIGRILVTSDDLVNPVEVLASGDADGVLHKPFELDALHDLIKASIIVRSVRPSLRDGTKPP